MKDGLQPSPTILRTNRKWRISALIDLMSTLPETNSSPLKMDDWNTTFLSGRPVFSCYESFREGGGYLNCWGLQDMSSSLYDLSIFYMWSGKRDVWFVLFHSTASKSNRVQAPGGNTAILGSSWSLSVWKVPFLDYESTILNRYFGANLVAVGIPSFFNLQPWSCWVTQNHCDSLDFFLNISCTSTVGCNWLGLDNCWAGWFQKSNMLNLGSGFKFCKRLISSTSLQ